VDFSADVIRPSLTQIFMHGKEKRLVVEYFEGFSPSVCVFSCTHDLGRFSTCPFVSSVRRKLVGQSWGSMVIFPIFL
jgi:hypothetical protein